MKPLIPPFQEEGQVNETTDLEANSCRHQPGTNEAGGSPSRFTCSWFKNSTLILKFPNCFGLFFDLQPHGPRTRLYQVWPGKNVFFFRGRMICGPDPRGLIVTSMAIILADWIFCAYVDDIANSAPRAAFSILLTAAVMVNLFLTSTRDPGILPRNVEVSAPGEETGIRIDGSSSRRVICIEGVMVKVEYCKICRIHRPPRSCHCAVCDNCVERFDHHCPWISQCIGLRNYRYYLMFISSALVFFVYIFAFSWWRIRRDRAKTNKSLFKMLGDAPETFLLTLFSFMVIWFLGGIFIFHAYLIAFNQTGSENFKQRYAKNPNPHDKGLLRNIKEALFARLPPSTVNFRSVVEPDWFSIARVLAGSTRRADDPADVVPSS